VKLVVVEAPGKVKTIAQYLGPDYEVLATYGHVRNLPSKKGSVLPEEDFSLTWEVPDKAKKAMQAIVKTLKKVDTLILATDLDREGEAISWHVLQHLKDKKALRNDVTVQRVSFNAITKSAIQDALKKPRDLDMDHVDAYLARLSLDYLVGFTLSPVLWRKLPGTRSAGRVQSVALRLVVERDKAIREFVIQEYWTLKGLFADSPPFHAQLTHFQGNKIKKMDIADAEQAQAWCKKALSIQSYRVHDIQSKSVQRHPAPPFITSSLQQEASQKLGYSPSRTMKIAQSLYEGVDIDGKTLGLITYMRTDSTAIDAGAMKDLRSFIQKKWGKDHLCPTVRQYKKRSHSQEAHEAIRPTTFSLSPTDLKHCLSDELWKVYNLIWSRAVASQMASAHYDQKAVLIHSQDDQYIFRLSGSVLVFPGFLSVYQESTLDGEENRDENKTIPPLKVGQKLALDKMIPEQHFTQPPPRYSEASLIKELEERGIGRPSTYARILQVLKDRDYVILDKRRLHSTGRGSLVTAFLCHFFARYVDYDFTASMENDLDKVSSGKESWKTLMTRFWQPFHKTAESSSILKTAEVLETIQKEVMETQNNQCPKCKGTVMLRVGRSGPFLTCSEYPECDYTGELSGEDNGTKVLGQHPDTQKDVRLKKGPYGWYVEHDNKRSSLSTLFTSENIDLEGALWLLSLPLTLGQHPDTGEDVVLGIGRFGPYVRHNKRFHSLRKKDPKTLTIDDAIDIISASPERKNKKNDS
jgi:DNA topoisomerase-1